MGKTMAPSYLEEGIAMGERRGLSIGELRTLKNMRLRLAGLQFGPPIAQRAPSLTRFKSLNESHG